MYISSQHFLFHGKFYQPGTSDTEPDFPLLALPNACCCQGTEGLQPEPEHQWLSRELQPCMRESLERKRGELLGLGGYLVLLRAVLSAHCSCSLSICITLKAEQISPLQGHLVELGSRALPAMDRGLSSAGRKREEWEEGNKPKKGEFSVSPTPTAAKHSDVPPASHIWFSQ